MKRYLCALAICLIIVILGLYKTGIVLFEYKVDKQSNNKQIAIIESNANEKQYIDAYNAKIKRKKIYNIYKKIRAKV